MIDPDDQPVDPTVTPALALDFGTAMGWSRRHASGCVTSGVKYFRHHDGDVDGTRFLRFYQWLLAEHKSEPFKQLYFERVQFAQRGNAPEVWFSWLTICRLVCVKHYIGLHGFHTGTIKSLASGNGHASKERMKHAARDHFPHCNVTDDNQADALCTLYVGELWKAGKIQPKESAKAKKRAKKRQQKQQGELFR